MARVSVAEPQRSPSREHVEGFELSGGTIIALFDRPTDPIHAHVHFLPPHATLSFARNSVDRVAYIWHGDVTVDRIALPQGSSVIAERGAVASIQAAMSGATVVTFGSSSVLPADRTGGSRHVLLAAAVPRFTGENGIEGALHAAGDCPTCSVWLHENSFPPAAASISHEAAEAGIHCHSESEVIFITGGSMRLGRKLVGPGTAIAIGADTMYSFTPGPEGLRYLNFRAKQPSDIRFKNGHVIDEAGYWRDRVPTPVYL